MTVRERAADESESGFDNPYFDAVAGGVTVGTCRGQLTSGPSERAIEVLTQRQQLVETYAWAIPNEDAVNALADCSPLVEVGAGTGYWAKCVNEAGGDILATDIDPDCGDWFPVWVADARTVAPNRANKTLVMIWPEYDAMWPVATLGAYLSAGGEKLVYVGEGRGGCTANDRFHEMLHGEMELVETVDIPTYEGIHDRLEVWGG